ncbi:Ribose-phosphate pyrophosphokinase, partial [Dillenia turbinata]
PNPNLFFLRVSFGGLVHLLSCQMASISLRPPPSASYSASSSSSLFSCRAFASPSFFRNDHPRIFASNAVIKCDMSDPLKSPNGKPTVPIINEQTLPKFLDSKPLENMVSRKLTKLRLFSGSANPSLSQEIAWCMGLELGKINIKRFADGEIYVQLQESVRGCDVYLVQPTCTPANENLMELLVMIDACRRASAKTITAVIPYFGYARADRKAKPFVGLELKYVNQSSQTQGRESIAAKLVANLITEAGAHRVVACDLHSGQSMGYFDIPVDPVRCQSVILDYLASKKIASNDLVVVSPDVGGVARARAFAKKLSDAPLAIVDKRRHGHNVAEVMNLIGDVKGKVAIMVDDMIDTAGTISKGAALLHQEGARDVYACCTHAVLSPPAIERLSGGLFQEVIVTNTIPLKEKNDFPQLTVLSVANLLGETIWRVHGDCSVSSIFL